MSTVAGVIGLGEMGAPIVRHWLDEGYEVHAFDLDEEKVAAAAEAGAEPAESVPDLVDRCDVSLIVVGTGDQVEETLFGDDGVVDSVSEDDIIIVSSTVHPERCVDWLESLPDGTGLVDAPIARGRSIEDQDALVFAGGPDDVVEQVTPLLDTFSRDVVHLGDTGTGQMGKAANNHLLWACHTANYDALRLADAYGVDTDKLRDGLKQSSGDNYALHRWEKATGKWAEDDLRIVSELMEELDVDLPQTERTRDAMEALEMEDIWTLTPVDYRGASE